MSHVPQIHSEVADLGAVLGKAYIHWDDKRQQGLIEDAYLRARNDMERWAADYRRNNKAGNALDAQAAYEAQWNTITGNLNNIYKEKLSNGAMHVLRRHFELGRLYAINDGARYQAQQTDVWEKNRENVRLQQMLDDVNNDPDDLARHQINVNENVHAWEIAHPCQDSYAYRRKLEGAVAENVVSGLIARKDCEGAERLLNHWGGTTDPSSSYIQVPSNVIKTRGQKGFIADDQNNPWNLSKKGSTEATPRRQRFQVFNSPEEGTLAAFNQLVRYNQGRLGATIDGVDAQGKRVQSR